MSDQEPSVPTVVYRAPIRRKIGEKQEGTIKIGAEIIEVLSEGIYTSPENALKELISNSFDSDATELKITFDRENRVLRLEDNGKGMDYLDFDNNFSFITGSEKRAQGELTARGRPIIGKIGIGFVSASQLCEKMIVRSTKETADTKFEAEINWGEIRNQIKEITGGKKEFYEISQYSLTNQEKGDIKEHFTVIELRELTREILEALTNKKPRYEQSYKFEESSFDDISDWIAKNLSNTDKQLAPYWSFVVTLASIIPVAYTDIGPIRSVKMHEDSMKAVENISDLKSEISKLGFKVTFDGVELRKPVVLPCRAAEDEPLEHDVFWFDKDLVAEDDTELRVKGYFYLQHGRIEVENWRGLVVRIKNTAVGGPDNSFMDYAYPGEKLYMPWTYGELYAVEGLEPAMNINRSSFKLSHPHYRALKKFIHEYMHKVVFAKARQRYYERREEKESRISGLHYKARRRLVHEGFGSAYSMTVIEGYSDDPVKYDPVRKQIEVYTRSKILAKRKPDHRLLLGDVLVAFEAAIQGSRGEPKKLRELFLKYLEELPRE